MSFVRPSRGVENELRAFFGAAVRVGAAGEEGEKGFDGLGKGKEAGEPRGALVDVAFIQAALQSGGEVVDLGNVIAEKRAGVAA